MAQPTAQIPPRGLAASHPVLSLSAKSAFIKALAEQLDIFTQALTDPSTENPLIHLFVSLSLSGGRPLICDGAPQESDGNNY